MENRKSGEVLKTLTSEEINALKYIFQKLEKFYHSHFSQHELFFMVFGCVQLVLPTVDFIDCFVVLKFYDDYKNTKEKEIEVALVSSKLKKILVGFCSEFEIIADDEGKFVYKYPAALKIDSKDKIAEKMIDMVFSILNEDKVAVYTSLKAYFKNYNAAYFIFPNDKHERVKVIEK